MIAKKLLLVFKQKEFKLKDAYEALPEESEDSIRGRIYENLGKCFERIGRGIYTTIDGGLLAILGDGRDLSMIEDESIDCILTDHPWLDEKSNKGGNRDFANYNSFTYTLQDFKEKARVLKPGCFCCEIIPAENASNWKYLADVKKMAEDAGLLYYSLVSWEKEGFVANTGRKSKNTEDCLFLTKGKARNMRIDVKKTNKEGVTSYMSGSNGMLPTRFLHKPVSKKTQINESEKPSDLMADILDYITYEGEVVLDQFAGSGSVGSACIHKKRNCILIEQSLESFQNLIEKFQLKKIAEELAYS